MNYARLETGIWERDETTRTRKCTRNRASCDILGIDERLR
jgi:hypothetical protein